MEIVKNGKPSAFYSTFDRKGQGEKNTHYCPGCGHGIAHKLIAEATSDLGINDRVIFCSPVGCSVYAYHYLDYGNIECAHGRAPAVATGLKRSRENAILISYQGDGDLAGIGMGAVMHAANRGELITIFFINNAIYGMTGGQMAPTTLLGQKTMTSPLGRSFVNEGGPIGMSEVISSLKSPVYVERVSLADATRVMKARAAIRKALKCQIDRKGFSFVEILSPCPINWKMTPLEACKWMKETMEEVFPLKVFRDTISEAPVRDRLLNPEISNEEILNHVLPKETYDHSNSITNKHLAEELHLKIAGFGGQGIMVAGILSADCAVSEGYYATWIPSYGAEMRGGTANSSVIISGEKIGSPVVSDPHVLIAMNQPSLSNFEQSVRKGGTIIVNSSLAKSSVARKDIREIRVPATEIADHIGSTAVASVIMLAVFACVTKTFSPETLKKLVPVFLKKKDLIELNIKAIEQGVKIASSL